MAAPWDILRINPGPLLIATASLIAFCLGDLGILVIGSGSCRGVGGSEKRAKRPRGPSGEDCTDVSAGVVDDEVAEGVTADADVRVSGTAGTICCGEANCECVEVGDGRAFLTVPLVQTGEAVAEGAIFCRRELRNGRLEGLSAIDLGSL